MRDLLLRICVIALLVVYVSPVIAVTWEAVRIWIPILHNQTPTPSWISQAYVVLMAEPNGPLSWLNKAMGVICSAAVVSRLWTPKDWMTDVTIIAILLIGGILSLVAWSVLGIPDVGLEVEQSLPSLTLSTKEFIVLRDQYFSTSISTLVSFGAVLTGVKLKGQTNATT